jgi:hypothetical protein
VTQRLGVVRAEVLDVMRLEPRALERELDAREVERGAVREDVALREGTRLGLPDPQPREKIAQLYVIDSSRKSRKKSFETS